MRHAAVALPALAGLALFGCAARSASPQPPLSKATARYVAYLENPARAAWQKPDEVVGALRLKGGEQVTDLGTGSGYFSRRLATAVGPSGRIDAADVDEGMLTYLRERAEMEGIRNLAPRHVAADDPALPPASTDLVFLCDAYHHLRDRVAYFQKVAGGLKADGRLVIVDFHKREDIAEGPPFAEKLARETVVHELRQAGFEVEREESFLPYQYFLVLRRAPRYSSEPLAEKISAVMSSEAEARVKQWQVAALLSDYLQGGALEAKFQRPNPGLRVTTYLLYTDPAGRFSIAALVFQPRARTTIHDHQSWVVWGTYTGKERETRYRRRDVPGQSFPHLTPAWKRVFAGGEVSFIDPPPGDIHDVENVNDSVSVSLHVHATDIGEQARNSYDVQNKIVKSFVQSYEPGM
jgi:predicted metal-dependent enzyme (double-stranded beta helix superfamily)/predicted methyltransferase